MNTYDVYELDEDDRKSFIATVMAEDDEEAMELALEEYGAPLAVVPE